MLGNILKKELNTNWPRSEEALDDIPYNIPGLDGPPFSKQEVQKVVKAVKSRKAPGADRIAAEALKADGQKMIFEMLLKICDAA